MDFSCHTPNAPPLQYEACRRIVAERAFTQLPWQSPESLAPLALPSGIKNICVVGMGGSSLGAKAITSALECKDIYFLDNIDPHFIGKRIKELDLKRTLFILASKSGETIEVLSLAQLLFSKIKAPKNFLAVTDAPHGALGRFAREKKIPLIESPAHVPGRFSVLSIVGLLPAHLAGISWKEVLEGARRTTWKDAFKLAALQHAAYIKKKPIAVFFPYSERLDTLSDWYIQLLAESIGKSKKIGITPIKAMGAKDQHSQLQLFLDGPDDKFFILLKESKSAGAKKNETIPGKRYSLAELYNAEYRGVVQALKKRKRLVAEIYFEKIDAKTLGELFFFFELEVAFLGEFFRVNSENQPAVELSKSITKSLLK